MLDSRTKQQAYATMDDASSFRFHVVPAGRPPLTVEGEDAVAVLEAETVAAIREPVKLLRHMARTFFGEKFTGLAKPPETDGPVKLFIVAELSELDGSFIEGLSDEGSLPPAAADADAPHGTDEAPAILPLSKVDTLPLSERRSQQDTLRLSDQVTLDLASDEDWD